MLARTDLTDALLALIPEDGSRLSNEAMALASAAEVEEPFGPEELEAAKAHVVAMGAGESERAGRRAQGRWGEPASEGHGASNGEKAEIQQWGQVGGGRAHPGARHHRCHCPHRRAAQPDRSGVERLLERWHCQPVGSVGAAHLFAVHSTAG
jgi:hypothetical protein